jgi:hypothetical protein
MSRLYSLSYYLAKLLLLSLAHKALPMASSHRVESSPFDEHPPNKSTSKIMPTPVNPNEEPIRQEPDSPELHSSPPKPIVLNPNEEPEDDRESETSDSGFYFQPGPIPTYDEYPPTLNGFSAYYLRRQNASDEILHNLNNSMNYLLLRNRMSMHSLNQEILDLHTDLDDIKAVLNLLVRAVNRTRFMNNPPKSAGLGSEDGSGVKENSKIYKENSRRQMPENEGQDNKMSAVKVTDIELADALAEGMF